MSYLPAYKMHYTYTGFFKSVSNSANKQAILGLYLAPLHVIVLQPRGFATTEQLLIHPSSRFSRSFLFCSPSCSPHPSRDIEEVLTVVVDARESVQDGGHNADDKLDHVRAGNSSST